jgi:glycosyltransferase involved in cell wall biosynthesis
MNKLQVHSVEQPESDITAFVLSCNRLEVLDQTLKSFLATKNLTVKLVILDDSAEPGVFETLVERYGNISDVICFPRNRGQWWALDFLVSYCDTEYIFYIEDDWQFLESGYLERSLNVLKNHRDIGTVDISGRTLADQGYVTHEPELVDGEFYYKRFWRVSDYHYHWYGWTGSPNLKRRDDLILLGRVEKWHNEWNIDRRFLALGLRSVFLTGKYVQHLGDTCSRMAGQRPDDSKTPEDFFPAELRPNRVYPEFDYFTWDRPFNYVNDITLVTALVDLQIRDRNFESRYLASVMKILESRHPIVIFSEPRFRGFILAQRAGRPTTIIDFTTEDLEKLEFFPRVLELVGMPSWRNQADWIESSALTSFYYLPFSLVKQKLLETASQQGSSSYYYWLDPDMFTSYEINTSINDMYFTRVPRDRFFMLKFPFSMGAELHGLHASILEMLAGAIPEHLVRGTMFGGTPDQISKVTEEFYKYLGWTLNSGTVGAEEAIYTILSMRRPDLIGCVDIASGDIREYINKLR